MGYSSSDNSESPIRGRGSPPRRSPNRRERSPPRHKISRASRSPAREKPSSRTRSPKPTKSPVSHSPVRDKRASRPSSQRRAKSPVPHSPVKEKPSNRTRSPKHSRSRSPVHRLPVKEKSSTRTRLPVVPKSRSPESRSPSPRSKRLRRAQGESVREKVSAEHERNHGRGADRPAPARKGREVDREVPSERRERKSGRDEIGNGSSKSRHAQTTSPSNHHRSRHRSHSPSATTRARDQMNNSRGGDLRNDDDDDDDAIAQMKAAEEALETKEKQKPSFELSGKLAAETNRVRGITLQFNEAPDARKPDIRWRLYVFKGGEVLNEPLYVHRQTHYLFGRERRVADIPTDHPSCSKQHAVLQYRQVEKEQPDGTLSKQVRPYVMDLGSTNGTFINDNRIEPQRYYELFEKDTLKFGNSSREYVLLHENSA